MSNVTILDGGFSTQLTKHVTDRIDGHPLWTARFLTLNPEAIVQTHLDFLNSELKKSNKMFSIFNELVCFRWIAFH